MPARTSIGRRLTLIIWGSATLLFIIVGAGALTQQYFTTRHRTEESLYSLARLLSNGLQTAVSFEDAARAEELLSSLKDHPLVVDARIVLANGSTLARQGRLLVLTDSRESPLSPGLHERDNITLYNLPMCRGQEQIATLQLAMSRQPLREQTLHTLIWYGSGVVLMLGLTLLQVRLVHSTVLTPLSRLEDLAAQYRENADTHARAPADRDDELGSLARSMNGMLDAIQRREETLRRITLIQRTLIDNAPHGIISASSDGIITSVNPAACLLTGYSAPELVGLATLELFHDPEELSREAEELSHKLGRPIAPTITALADPTLPTLKGDHEWTFIRKDRSRRRVLLSISPILDAAGTPTGLVGMITDISERWAAEQERHRLEAQLHHNQKIEAIGTLAGGIAHDFNNILTGILGNADLALEDLPEGHAAIQSLDEVIKSAYRAKALVSSILTFSHHHEQARTVVPLWPVVTEAATLLRASLPATIRIETSTTEDCPPALADPGQIHQVVMNLGTNAAQAMEGSGGLLSITLHPVHVDRQQAALVAGLRPGSYLRLTISDTGCGMDEAVRSRIFEPFFTTRPSGHGAGLGLPVVHGIIEKHEGAVEVDSRPGQGSSFSVYLPTASAATPRAAPAASPADSSPRTHNHCILFVDDERPIARIAQRALERNGYHVDCCSDPLEALALFQKAPDRYHAVLTDLTMPGMSGVELTAELQKVRPEIPVLLCTGFGAGLNSAKVQSLGLAGLLTKPYSTVDLLKCVERLVLETPA
jgi:signal transduction histidine kinase/ActR/RegA family two-component response regulator